MLGCAGWGLVVHALVLCWRCIYVAFGVGLGWCWVGVVLVLCWGDVAVVFGVGLCCIGVVLCCGCVRVVFMLC